MNTQTQTQSKPAPVEVKPSEPTKLTAVVFVHPINFGSVSTSVRIGINCDTVTPVCFGAEGKWRAVGDGEASIGVVLRRKNFNRIQGKPGVDVSFVPWSNIAEMVYGYSE